MAEVSGISWTDATFNPWIGCAKISPACDHCYAERENGRFGWVAHWGARASRKRTKPATWRQPLLWNEKAHESGVPIRVFSASLADIFDNEVPPEWRADFWKVVRDTPYLRWIILSKRIGNAPDMLPAGWPFPHVGLMATIVNQREWDRDWPKLEAIPAAWRGVSMEPLLGYIEIGGARPDWIITGGESGPDRRDLDMGAVRSIRDQCARNVIAFHHKQNGGLRGKDAGCLVDGVEHKHFPSALAA